MEKITLCLSVILTIMSVLLSCCFIGVMYWLNTYRYYYEYIDLEGNIKYASFCYERNGEPYCRDIKNIIKVSVYTQKIGRKDMKIDYN